MTSPPRSNSSVAHKVEALQAILAIMQSRPRAFDAAAARALWARLGALAIEASGSRRAA